MQYITFFIMGTIVLSLSCGHLKMARQTFDEENYTQTIDMCQTAIEHDSTDAEAHFLMGSAFIKIDSLYKAKEALEQALYLDSENEDYKQKLDNLYCTIADTLVQNEALRDAVSYYEKSLDLYKANPFAIEKKADVFIKLGKYDEAKSVYIRALENTTDSTRILSKIDEIETDEKTAQQLLKEGVKARKAKEYEKALIKFKEALALKPDYKEAKYQKHIASGLDWYKQGSKNDLWEAIMQFGHAAAIYPDRGEPHYYMGLAYNKKDKNEYINAIDELEKAAELEPDSPYAEKAQQKATEIRKRKKKMEEFWGR